MTRTTCLIAADINIKELNKRLNGPSRLAVELKKRLTLNHKVWLLTMSNFEGKEDNLISIRKKNPILMFFELLISLKKINPDIIHGHGSFGMARILSFIKVFTSFNEILLPFAKSSAILTFTGFDTKARHKYKLLSKLDGIICQNEYTKKELIDDGVSSQKIRIVRYGVEDFFHEAKIITAMKEKGKNVLFWGDGTLKKGFDTFISSIQKVLSNVSDVFFIICVRKLDPRLEKGLEGFIKNESVILWRNGRYPYPIQDIIKSADVVVLPYAKNTLEPPLTLIESLAVGSAVITTDVGGNGEAVGDAGVLIDPNNPNQLSNAIIELLTNDEKREELKNKSSEAVGDYNWEVCVNEIEEFYDDLLSYEYQTFKSSYGEVLLSSIEEELLLKYLEPKPNDTILDIGTGPGRMATRVIEKGAMVYGIDKNTKMLLQAKKRKINPNKYALIQTDISNPLPFKNSSFDSTYCVRVLKYVPNYGDVIKEASRVLKSEGIFVLEISNVYSWELILRFLDKFRINKPNRYRLFNKSEIIKLLEKHGFEVIETQPLHKLPNPAWRILGTWAYRIDAIFKKILPEQILSRGIIIKSKLKR